jgi:hypothetical protein
MKHPNIDDFFSHLEVWIFIRKWTIRSLDSLAIKRFHYLKKDYFITWKKIVSLFGDLSPEKKTMLGTSLWEMTQKEALMFECYNLSNSMEWGVVTFWNWCPIKQL